MNKHLKRREADDLSLGGPVDPAVRAPETPAALTHEQIAGMSRADMCTHVRRVQLRLLAEVEEMEAFARWWNIHRPGEVPFAEVETELRNMIRGMNIIGEEPLHV